MQVYPRFISFSVLPHYFKAEDRRRGSRGQRRRKVSAVVDLHDQIGALEHRFGYAAFFTADDEQKRLFTVGVEDGHGVFRIGAEYFVVFALNLDFLIGTLFFSDLTWNVFLNILLFFWDFIIFNFFQFLIIIA